MGFRLQFFVLVFDFRKTLSVVFLFFILTKDKIIHLQVKKNTIMIGVVLSYKSCNLAPEINEFDCFFQQQQKS